MYVDGLTPMLSAPHPDRIGEGFCAEPVPDLLISAVLFDRQPDGTLVLVTYYGIVAGAIRAGALRVAGPPCSLAAAMSPHDAELRLRPISSAYPLEVAWIRRCLLAAAQDAREVGISP